MAELHGKLLSLVEQHRLVVIDAATGSGKSTHVPLCLAQHCVEAGRRCRIVVTQPRRLAAKGLARRVAQQSGTKVGDIAGYRVGSDRQDRGALVVYVTAGHLLEALVHNPRHLDSFSHIVLDEVHERFVEADFLMALLRLGLSRPDTQATRIVVMSATLQPSLADFFRPLFLPSPGDATPGHLSLPGRTPFEVRDLAWEDIRGEWPGVLMGVNKEPSFLDFMPSKLKLLPPRRRSDQLTKFCKEMAPHCARLLWELSAHGINVALVFLPGLDQMREVEGALAKLVANRGTWPEVFLMHSALEEETYRGALDPTPPGTWRVVLATNVAESSLTVPGVGAVVDFGMHRVNMYDDETRMSMLATEWCSQASLKQRRGRTGRTNPGVCIRLFPKSFLEDLRDYDESGVERSPLTRITLEAAHLAQLLSSPPELRAGMPVVIAGVGPGVANYWDGPGGGWCVTEQYDSATHAESTLRPLPIDARRLMHLLPTPPKEDRVQSALLELHELGALASMNTPNVLGAACLKLPVDVPLARLVALGWALGCATDAVVLAAALSLAPTCDVLRTPFNTKSVLEHWDMKTLRTAVDLRRRADAGALSEPLTVHALCMEWLASGGGDLGSQPSRVPWRDVVHVRLWTQLTDKVIDLTESLLRLVPSEDKQADALRSLLQRARGRYGAVAPPRADRRSLTALLTWALAPQGFIAVGQTPAIYGGAGPYNAFMKAVRKHGGSAASSLWWPKAQEKYARDVAVSSGCAVRWSDTQDGEAFIGLQSPNQGVDRDMHEGAEFLCRICGPFNGKETYVYTQGNRTVAVRPPRHPCVLNWYMPRRDGTGVLEVRVNWKSQAETLLHVPRPGDRGARCRPKRLLVASGGEYHSTGGRRMVMLRGITLLPAEDGGRAALLWLLAAGVPREAKLVALAAPSCGFPPTGDFELRALRLWQRTLCLPPGDPLSSGDLRAVNAFRRSLLELQRRRPHRLAGTWRIKSTGEVRYVEYLDAAPREGQRKAEGREELTVSGGPSPLLLGSLPGHAGGARWRLEPAAELPPGGGPGAAEAVNGQETAEGSIHWEDGACWEQVGAVDGQVPLLAALAPESVAGFRRSAGALLDITGGDQALGLSGGCGDPGVPRWPARLVPLRPDTAGGRASHRGAACMLPFDLGAVEAQIAAFASRLEEDDLESDEEEEGLDDASDDDDDAPVDVSNENVNEEFMWRLAQAEDWGPSDSRQLCFVESAVALPPTLFCVECEKEGKLFSKGQQARHPDERRCQDCIMKSNSTIPRLAGACALGGSGAAVATKAAGAPALPAYAARTGPINQQAATCSVCSTPLTKENCSVSQRAKVLSRRRCNGCVGAK